MNGSLLGLLALSVLLASPASAVAQTRPGASSGSAEFSAQTSRRPRITVYPRRRTREAKRHCRSWLAKEYRVSGPVIVPRMRCWWE